MVFSTLQIAIFYPDDGTFTADPFTVIVF